MALRARRTNAAIGFPSISGMYRIGKTSVVRKQAAAIHWAARFQAAGATMRPTATIGVSHSMYCGEPTLLKTMSAAVRAKLPERMSFAAAGR